MSVATRGIEREISSLQLEEKKLVAEIKKTAKTGNEASLFSHKLAATRILARQLVRLRQQITNLQGRHAQIRGVATLTHKPQPLYHLSQASRALKPAATRILARQLVRLRQQITNLQGSRAQIRGVATHTQALYASTSISTGMKGATKAMVAMNKQMAPAKQVKVIKEFQKQSAQMDMTIEMMSESIDETLDKDEAEEETEELTNQVLDEIGVDIASQLSSAPKGRIGSKKVENVVPSSESPDVEELEKRLASLRRI
ncbi:Vacuolar protein sorting-associated protein 2-like 2 [Vitis vinifera]|uniref:Vacuolar protein sorting-associated protein 2-like 2 n=1 Tax=Vitis vinifera TaxID=29760 RepID=A0A438J792_VITVI|nr:Vacuolar protein sorting-associated protein 2-like 2 [Vitis vinifera]